jgi:hypothetical protein
MIYLRLILKHNNWLNLAIKTLHYKAKRFRYFYTIFAVIRILGNTETFSNPTANSNPTEIRFFHFEVFHYQCIFSIVDKK